MVDGRQLGSTIRVMVAQDEVFGYGPYASGIRELILLEALNIDAVFHWGDGSGILLGALPKHENN